MKNFKYLLALLLHFAFIGLQSVSGQAIFRVNADTLRMWSLGNTGSELAIENDTRYRTGGFLKNRVNGRTEFAYAVDSTRLSNDTLWFHRGDGWYGIKLPSGG